MAKLAFCNIFIVLFLWLVVNLTYVKSMPHEDFLIGHKDIGLRKGHLACHCGIPEKIMEKDLDIKTAHKIFREVVHDKDFLDKMKDFNEVQEFVGNCWKCNLTYINCSEELCVKKAAKFSLETNVSQTETTETSEILRMSNATQMKHNEFTEATTSRAENKYNASTNGTTSNANETKADAEQLLKKVSGTPVNASLNEIKGHASSTPANASLNEIKGHAMNNSKTDDKIPNDYNSQITNISIDGYRNHSRNRRFIGCSYPSKMETAAISCRVYPSSIKCVQRCAFGYTLDSGIQKEMQCKFKENRWVPSGFKECLPFVDCSVTLSSGGSATCTSASEDKAPSCQIQCLHYEDKPPVPMAIYKCKVDGTWEPPLPFCAIAGSGMVLVPPPRNKN